MLDYGFYNMDCVEGMRQFPDEYFDLAVVDPPYGIGESGKKNATRSALVASKAYKEYNGADREPPEPEYFAELFRVSKYVVVWGANHFISRMPYDASCWLVWDKDNGGSDFADCELAWTNFHCAVRKFRFRWAGMLQENMKEKEIRIHPNQKPVVLYDWIFQRFISGAINSFLDTHVGSASSLIACHRLGIPFVGFEIDSWYYKEAVERLKRETAQITLFNM